MSMSPEDRIAKYKAAYERANGRECVMTYSNGWYTLNRATKFRAGKVDELTGRLKWIADSRVVADPAPRDLMSGEIGSKP
jgi:hypothetical protein